MRLILFLISLSFFSCSKPIPNEEVLYNNEFKQKITNRLSGAIFFEFNGTQHLGPYNRGGFQLSLNNIPKHNLIIIEADILIHDTWDGNSSAGGIDGPDIWNMYADDISVVKATFSNSSCEPLYCLYQSYPSNYGTVNNPPKSGAKNFFQGKCWNKGSGTSSFYHVIKTISHKNNSLELRCMDELIQKNTADPLCDESWSLSGLVVKSVLVK